MARSLPALLLLLSSTSGLDAQGGIPPDGGDRAEAFARALRVTLAAVRDVEAVPGKVQARIVQVTGGTAADAAALGRARLFRARFASARPRREGDMVFCHLPRAEGAGSVVAAVDSQGTVRAAVLDEDLAPRTEFSRFCAQFLDRPAPRLEAARTAGDLQERRAALQKSEAPEAALTRALLAQREQMRDVLAPLTVTFQLWSGAKGEDRATECIERMHKYAELDAPLAELLGDKRARYRQAALDIAAKVGEVRQAVADKKDARALLRGFQTLCNSCHGMRTPQAPGGLRKRAAELRLERGFGDDYYLVGHDVQLHGLTAARAQRAATALRRALLLVDAVRAK